ncbi:hypothetical protein EVAR_40206_1 [Eumeta japonica]|uniref:Chitin-binding type-2 domain-containing protein n=1 Tax=Eumeta variegata TaxID=151549 RepID=A0A4C1XP27_EUMVA|nr:hypothetical protein EVAR_40206_1 [Eumeta japonica]
MAEVSFFANDFVDDIENVAMAKLMRDMANQTKADTLNLPANATSIRENITDTFSCEDRVYGYYADVDNDCQIFHVCLPSLGPSGKNTTYRWSFICPEQTIFNQEVMVCTRKIDSIDCEDSPMFYDKNLEFGKVTNKTDEAMETETNANTLQGNEQGTPTDNNGNRKDVNRRKQNIVALNLDRIKEYVEQNGVGSMFPQDDKKSVEDLANAWNDIDEMNSDKEAERIAEERSFRTEQNIRPRRIFRFKADAL